MPASLSPLAVRRTADASVWHGIALALDASLLLDALLGVIVAALVVHVVRLAVHRHHAADPMLRFHPADRTLVLARAGHRCEHHSIFGTRCPLTDGLQADHIHPHSHGGWTAVANGQALCARHHVLNPGAVPWGWQLHRLERRRGRYFPAGQSVTVVRHRPAPATALYDTAPLPALPPAVPSPAVQPRTGPRRVA